MLTPKRHIFVCVNERPPGAPLPCCAHKGGMALYEALRSVIAQSGLNREVWVTRTGCMVHCTSGVTVVIYPDDVWYGGVTVADVSDLMQEHIIGGRPLARLRLA
jgi:(2Fe-2S) ferredoxin